MFPQPPQKTNAYKRVQRAVNGGLLTKSPDCDLCGAGGRLVAHHWCGYSDEHATDVWWICHGCNMKLTGERFHDGSVTMEQAKVIVRARMEKQIALMVAGKAG